MEKDLLMEAIEDDDPQVRKAAVWISEAYLIHGDEDVIEAIGKLKDDEDYDDDGNLKEGFAEEAAGEDDTSTDEEEEEDNDSDVELSE